MINHNFSPLAPIAPPLRSASRSAFWTFYPWWVVASIVGFAAGALLLTAPDVPLTNDMGSRAAGQLLLLLGLPASILQWWALRHRVRRASLWMVATLAGTAVAFIAATLFPPYYEAPTVLLIPIFVSIAQTLALWYFVSRATAPVLLWIIASPLITGACWGVGMLLMLMTGNFTTAYLGPWYLVLIGFTVFIGLPVALLTGLYLAWVFNDIPD